MAPVHGVPAQVLASLLETTDGTCDDSINTHARRQSTFVINMLLVKVEAGLTEHSRLTAFRHLRAIVAYHGVGRRALDTAAHRLVWSQRCTYSKALSKC